MAVKLKPISEAEANLIVLQRSIREALDTIPTLTNGKDGKDGIDGVTTTVTREVLANKEKLLEKGEFEEFKAMMIKMENDIRQSLAQSHNYFAGGGMAELVNVIEVSEDTTIRVNQLVKNQFNVVLVLTAGITVTLPIPDVTKIVWIQQGYIGNGEFTVCKAT